MTDTNDSPMMRELRTWLDTWKSSTQSVLSQVAAKTIEFDISDDPWPAPESPESAADVWYTVASSGMVRGEMMLRLNSATGATMAQMFMGAVDPPATVLNDELKEGLEELLRQIAGQAATALKALFGGEVQLQVSASAAPSWPAAATEGWCSRSGADAALALEILISAALLASLQPRAEVAAPAASTSAAWSGPPSTGSYDRLMDVGLEVKLRFGSRRMILREVLALSTGVVVELDRKLHAPADLLLDGRVIAQGEVVVVDGKYGLRVTEVFDPRPNS
jgi:flagellar motor switch protein FliN